MINIKPKDYSLTHIVEIGLIYWIQKQCKSIDNIQLHLNNLKLGLINSKISSISLKARNINVNNFLISKLSLETEEFRFGLNLRENYRDIIAIKDDFNINAKIQLKEYQLKSIIFSEEWGWLKNWLSSKFLDNQKILDLEITKNTILIKAIDKRNQKKLNKHFSIVVSNGKLTLKDLETLIEEYIPMDKLIVITK